MVGVISLADARRHCRIEPDPSVDADLTGFIASAGREIERRCGMICPQRQVEIRVNRFSAQLRLAIWPVASVEVHYLDTLGVEHSVPEVRVFEMHGIYRVAPAPGSCWPRAGRFPGAVRITAQAGFAAASDEAPANCPADAQHAARLMVAHWFDDRAGADLPRAVQSLLEPLRDRRC